MKSIIDKLSLWQKRLAIIAAIIGSLMVIIPVVQNVIIKTTNFLNVEKRLDILENRVDSLYTITNQLNIRFNKSEDYGKVYSGIIRSVLPKIDNNKYFVKIGEQRYRIDIRGTASGNLYGFIGEDKTIPYFIIWNNDEQKYGFFDFDGKYYLIYKREQ